MIRAIIVSLISLCTKYVFETVSLALLIAGISGYYAAHHFAINTDINTLISDQLPWRQRELDYEKSFPDRHKYILAVVDAPSSELAALARTALTDKLAADNGLFSTVTPLGGTTFFAQNGLLFRSTAEVGGITRQLMEAS